MFYNLDNQNNILNPSTRFGEKFSNIDYFNFVNAPENYYVYDEATDEIIKNPNFENEIEQKEKENVLKALERELEELDKKRIRAICEPSIKNEETQETWLDFYNSQVVEVRNKIIELKTETE